MRILLLTTLTLLTACDVAAPMGGSLADGLVQPVTYDGAGGSQAYIIDSGDGRVVLIDTGLDEDAGPILDALADLDRTADDVAAVFITHGHPDHIGGAAQFDAPLYARPEERPLITGEQNPERPFPNFDEPEATGLDIDVPVADGEVYGFGYRTVEVFALPGHTAGHTVYLSAGVLFMGDSASATSEGELNGATWLFSRDTAENDASLAALRDRLDRERDRIHTLAPAHSEALLEGLAPLDRYLDGV